MNDELKPCYTKSVENVSNSDAQLLLDQIHEIKSYEKPPYLEKDPYYLRYPWDKFGGISSGIYEKWYWYRDTVILGRATEQDIQYALLEIRT